MAYDLRRATGRRDQYPLDKFALLPEPHLDLVEHRAPRAPLVGELLLALHVLDDELAVGVVLVDGVELLLPARSFGVVER